MGSLSGFPLACIRTLPTTLFPEGQMKVLLIGGDGMLGHRIYEVWKQRHEVVPTLHHDRARYEYLPEELKSRARFGIDVANLNYLAEILAEERPALVFNAAGIVKQREEAGSPLPCIEINALFPHRLALLCRLAGARLVHLSTDCVFSGRKGNYSESDLPDPPDLYGRSKLLGEVGDAGCLTLRTSMIGLEWSRKASLVEWFLSQTGGVRGYSQAIFSGLTTTELARAIEHLVVEDALDGVWHLAAEPISKYALLAGLNRRLGLELEIREDDTFRCDRSLNASALFQRTRYRPPSWDLMLDELAEEVRNREKMT
jgi:dTDP-4-dehydrorhamnose reductase